MTDTMDVFEVVVVVIIWIFPTLNYIFLLKWDTWLMASAIKNRLIHPKSESVLVN